MCQSPPGQPADASDGVSRARELAGLFCRPVERFGTFRGVRAEEVPQPQRGLLDHHGHMTVAMERFHGGAVTLKVVATGGGAGDDGGYAREILLIGPGGTIVQQGIVRLDLRCVGKAVAEAIRAAREPLGRILIDAGLLRDVQRVRLLEVEPGTHLATLLAGPAPGRPAAAAGGKPFSGRLFGRVAEIRLDGRPAVELLEIVAPSAG